MKKGIILAAVVCLLAIPGFSYAMGLEAAIGVWRQNLDGETSYKGTTVNDIINLNTDFNADRETRGMGRVKIDMPSVIPNIYVMATHMEFEGTGKKTTAFRFGDIDVAAGVPIEGRLKLNHVDLGLFYSLPFLKLATLKSLNIDLGINLRVTDMEGRIRNMDTGESDSDSYTLPIPMLYGGIQLSPTDRFAIEAEARVVSLSGNHLYSVIGRIKGKVFGPMFLAGGYRYDNINLNEKNHLLECSVDGFFVETGFAF